MRRLFFIYESSEIHFPQNIIIKVICCDLDYAHDIFSKLEREIHEDQTLVLAYYDPTLNVTTNTNVLKNLHTIKTNKTVKHEVNN